MGHVIEWLRSRIPKSKYARIAFAALLVFVVVTVLKGVGNGAFWAGITAAALFVLSFDPRIGRHW